MKIKVIQNKYKVTTSNGKIYYYDYVDLNPCYSKIRLVRTRKKFGYIKENGEPLCELIYDIASDFIEKRALVGIKGNEFHITEEGVPAYTERYEYATPFHEGFSIVSKNIKAQKFMYIDQDGKYLLNTEFDKAEHFCYGHANVEIDNRKGILDTKGKITWI